MKWTWKTWMFMLLYWGSVFAGFVHNVEPARVFVYGCWGFSLALGIILLFLIAGVFKSHRLCKWLMDADLTTSVVTEVVTWGTFAYVVGTFLVIGDNQMLYLYIGMTIFVNVVAIVAKFVQKILLDVDAELKIKRHDLNKIRQERPDLITDLVEGQDGVYQ